MREVVDFRLVREQKKCVQLLQVAGGAGRSRHPIEISVIDPALVKVVYSRVRALVQVNTSGEDAKGGFRPEEAVDAVGAMAELPGVRLEGMMTMAPFEAPEAVLRRTFAAARDLSAEVGRQVSGYQPLHLSMGMSGDYEIAVEEGSTMVRLGSVLFGDRER